MALDSPSTFSDWYWADQIEADKARSEEIEASLAPVAQAFIDSLAGIGELPPNLAAVLNQLKAPTAPDWDNVLVRFVSNVGAGLAQRILGHEIKEFDYKMNSYLHNTLITPEIAHNLMLRKKITPELWQARMLTGGFSELEGAFVYESMKPYPNLPDIIAYGRYHSDPENPREFVRNLYDISVNDWDMWNWLSFQKPNTEHVLSLFKRGTLLEFDAKNELSKLGWQGIDKNYMLELAYSLPNPMLLVQGELMQEVVSTAIIQDISKCDIHPDYAEVYLDGILTKPATGDIIQYLLRQDPNLGNLNKELRKIGVHPQYWDLYRELAYPIPPIADIITMAVREAFSPAIAARFGQYEDLPPEFVTWVGKKGLSKEWAERYWAAHWSLPSPQQGFEMLHRGIIGKDDLQLLMRALDIMPFWRDKMIQMSYQPLTRIDVRRMYQLGVLNEAEVYKAYQSVGYDDLNAKRMTDFTVKQIRQSLSRFTPADIVRAYTNRFIDAGEAGNLLRQIGIKEAEISYIVSTAGYKRAWAIKEDQITAIENLYKKHTYTETETRAKLQALYLPTDHIDTLLQQWQLSAKATVTATWTNTQTLSFLKKGLINRDRAITEFRALGYDEDHINVYLASAQTA
jgi:hypothetical protein